MATVGSVYAKAIFALGAESGRMLNQLGEFWDTCAENPKLVAVLAEASIPVAQRSQVLHDVLMGMDITGNSRRLLDLLVTRGRLAQLPEILHELRSLMEASQGVVAGTVRSAAELSQEELEKLGAALGKRVGSKVTLTQTVDPALLGGMVATVAGLTFDGSLRTQMEKFKNAVV